ncbi:MAG: hypothetical protein ACRC0G_03720 [Fusobacteriaceae bacterium]
MAKYNLKKILMEEFEIEKGVAEKFTSFAWNNLECVAMPEKTTGDLLLIDIEENKDVFLKRLLEELIVVVKVSDRDTIGVLKALKEKYIITVPTSAIIKELKLDIKHKQEVIEALGSRIKELFDKNKELKKQNESLNEFKIKFNSLSDFLIEKKDDFAQCEEDSFSFRLSDESLNSLGRVFLSNKTSEIVRFPAASVAMFKEKNKTKICEAIGIDYVSKDDHYVYIKENAKDEFIKKFNKLVESKKKVI